MINRLARTALFYAVLIVSFVVGTALTIIIALFSKDRSRPFQIAANRWAKLLVAVSGVKITTSGSTNIPKDAPVIFAANHQGAADILLALAYLPIGFRFAIKKELFNAPLLGWYMRQAGYFSIDREQFRSAYRSVESISELVKSGASVLIFPEGTRTTTGELGRFKRGSLLAALKSGAPIVPIAISGSYNILPKGSFLINPCPVKITFGQPIEIKSEEDYETKVESVRQAIAGML